MRLLSTYELQKLHLNGMLRKPHISLYGIENGDQLWKMVFNLRNGEIVGISNHSFANGAIKPEKYYYSCDTINLIIEFITNRI